MPLTRHGMGAVTIAAGFYTALHVDDVQVARETLRGRGVEVREASAPAAVRMGAQPPEVPSHAGVLREDFALNHAGYVGQAEISACIPVGQPRVIDTHQRE